MVDTPLPTATEAKAWLTKQIQEAPEPSIKEGYQKVLNNVDKIYEKGKPLVVKDGKLDLDGLKEKAKALPKETLAALDDAGKELEKSGRALYKVTEPFVKKAAEETGNAIENHGIGIGAAIMTALAAIFMMDLNPIIGILLGLLVGAGADFFSNKENSFIGQMFGMSKDGDGKDKEKEKDGPGQARFNVVSFTDNTLPSGKQQASGIPAQEMMEVQDKTLIAQGFDGKIIVHGKRGPNDTFVATGYEIKAKDQAEPGEYKKVDAVLNLKTGEGFEPLFAQVTESVKLVKAKAMADATKEPKEVVVKVTQVGNKVTIVREEFSTAPSNPGKVVLTAEGEIKGHEFITSKAQVIIGSNPPGNMNPVSFPELNKTLSKAVKDGKIVEAEVKKIMTEGDMKPGFATEIAKLRKPVTPGSPPTPGSIPGPGPGGPGVAPTP